jgi:hypothetical protein
MTESRDIVERLLRAWDRYESGRQPDGGIIDYDCAPEFGKVGRITATSRLDTLRSLQNLLPSIGGEETAVKERIRADIGYLTALLGERQPLADYLRMTQGCGTNGWTDEYIQYRKELALVGLSDMGIHWNSDTADSLDAAEGIIPDHDKVASDIRAATAGYESVVRELSGSEAKFEVAVESASIDAYWTYWLDGAGYSTRLRLNTRMPRFTHVRVRQFTIHEILGHAFQSASWYHTATQAPVRWVRILSVHTPYQVLLEGLAQALPLIVAPDDAELLVRVRLDHYLQLVRSELHLAINEGQSLSDCVEHARRRVPFWSAEEIGDIVSDRSVNPRLRSYLWAYPAGFDWFVALAEEGGKATKEVLRAAYREPLSPADLAHLWPAGPTIGGNRSS